MLNKDDKTSLYISSVGHIPQNSLCLSTETINYQSAR